jgi:FkbM family methyltransferase
VIKTWLAARVPVRHRTRLRYHYRALTGRLDRELALARRLLAPVSGVADIGANMGLYTYAFGRSARVDAFEPLPEPARILRALASTLPAARVHQVALSHTSGTATLYVPRIGGHAEFEQARFEPIDGPHDPIVVAVRTLDEYALEHIGLIKIDVEGHELDVLAGAAETIRRERPVLLVEIEQRHRQTDIADAIAAIRAHGYEGYFHDGHGESLRTVADFRYERHQAPYLGQWGDPRYVNNFLFVHESDRRAISLLARQLR